MTNNSPLDKHIKEKFSDYSPDVPSHIWENIMAEKDKRKPAAIWFWGGNKKIALFILGMMVAAGGFIIYKTVHSPGIKNEAVKTKQVNAENKDLENKTVSNNITTTGSNEKTTGDKNVETTSANNTNETANTISTEKNNVGGSKNKTATNATDNKHNLKQDKPNTDKTNPLLSSNNDDNNTERSTNKTGYKKPKKVKGTAVISYKNPDTISDDVMSDDVAANNSNDLLLNRLLLNPGMILSEKNFNASIKKINIPNLNIPCPEAEKNAAGNKKYFEIYGGPDYAMRSITDTGNSAYLQKRKESTSFSSAFSAGLRYTRVFGNGMSFRTGINYSQINEKFKFAQGNIIQVVYVIDNNGDTTGSYTTTGTRYKTTYNKFRTIDLPILVGYELGNGRLHANINAGVVVNLYSWQNGDVLDTAYQPVSITTGKNTSPYQFKTNVGIGFMGAVSVYYKITDRLHILAEPYYRYNFSPASKSDLTLKQKYNTMGLRLGLRLDF